VTVIKSAYTGQGSGPPGFIGAQTLTEVRRDDIVLVAPDEAAAKIW
jgi:hypothetical protein